MRFQEILVREYRREFEDHIQFDKGASRSIARRAAGEVPHGTICGRLPMRRKVIAYLRTFKYWRMNSKCRK